MKELALLLLGLGLLLSAVGGFFLVARLLKKGYNSPSIMFVILGPWIGPIGTLYLAPSYPESSPKFDQSLAFLGLSCAVSFLSTSVVVYALPKRNPRSAGDRKVRFPWKFAGYFFIALTIVSAILWAFGIRLNPFHFAALATICFLIQQRTRLAPMSDAIDNDKRPPVLYLRPFKEESQPFAVLSFREQIAFAQANVDLGFSVAATFEQYLMNAISRTLGPFVALGNPEDYLPLIGAARNYVQDDNWMKQFEEISEAAQCIVMEVNMSKNVEWELRSLHARGLDDKLVVFTLPEIPQSGWRYYLVLSTQFIPLKGYRSYLNRIPWGEFVLHMRSHAFMLMNDDPGPGAVIGFNLGCAYSVAKNVKNAADYDNALITWKSQHRVELAPKSASIMTDG